MKNVDIKFYGSSDNWASLTSTDDNVAKFTRNVGMVKVGDNNALVSIVDSSDVERFFCVVDIEMIKVSPLK